MKLTNKKAFTLVEMLIVIVIIGILAAALMPQFLGMQARARDVAREGGLKTISTALAAYAADHNGYYPGYDATNMSNSAQLFEKKEVSGKTIGGLKKYIEKFPADSAVGMKATNAGECSTDGVQDITYAYFANNINGRASAYAVTVGLEREEVGNTTNCSGTPAEKGTAPTEFANMGNARSLLTTSSNADRLTSSSSKKNGG